MINPSSVAFDVDGVFADTMTLFLDIAQKEYGINWIKPEDITSYAIEDCIDIDKNIINNILNRIIDGSYNVTLKAIDGAPKVLTRLGRSQKRLLFVTARPCLGPIYDWMLNILPLKPDSIEIVTTGTFEGKLDVLLRKNIACFVEDRLETCFQLKEAGITPILFKQPWNRKSHPFVEVETWSDLEELIEF
ncbi:MAG: haloacid dehalogenase [Candidatus Desulfaltia sp.]|nr:haloacid dehalogenase [Candidatus Desulfaltia sp.]